MSVTPGLVPGIHGATFGDDTSPASELNLTLGSRRAEGGRRGVRSRPEADLARVSEGWKSDARTVPPDDADRAFNYRLAAATYSVGRLSVRTQLPRSTRIFTMALSQTSFFIRKCKLSSVIPIS